MNNFNIETAQNISINQNVAHVTTRIGSYIIDGLFIGSYTFLVIFFMGKLNLMSGLASMSFYLLISLPVFFYSLLFETLMNGQTPGKYFNKIRVVKIDGSKPTFGSFLIRWLLRIVDLSLASGSVAVLTILLNGKGQRLGDLAANTTVISEKIKVTLKDTIASDIVEDYIPTYSQATLLTDSDMNSIRKIFKEAVKSNNHKVILILNSKIIDITGIKTQQKPVDFIDTIIKDYCYFTQQ